VGAAALFQAAATRSISRQRRYLFHHRPRPLARVRLDQEMPAREVGGGGLIWALMHARQALRR
jgi:hypothetical protein